MMLTLTIITLCVFVGYTAYILSRFGVIPSLSDGYYLMEEKEKGTGLYFSVWCAIITTFVLPPSIHVCDFRWQALLAVMMCIGLLFVGASPAFKRNDHRPYHLVGAILSALGAVLLSLVWGYWYIVMLGAILSLVLQYFTLKRDITLWLEIACFLAYFTSLILRLV